MLFATQLSVNLPIIAAFWSILDVAPASSLIDTKLHSNKVNETLNYIYQQ